MLESARRMAVAGVVWELVASCTIHEPQPTTYFQQKIAPTLTNGCVRSPTGSGCHVSDERGNAFGNLDVTLFSNIDKRRDLLVAYGPYPQPGLLLKNLPPMQIQVRAYDGTTTTVTTDIKHTGGPILDPTANAYQTLRRWIDNGATENNTGKKPLANASLACTPHTAYSTHDLTTDPPNADWPTFRDVIGPMLVARCGSGNCHGSASNDLSFSCGGKPEDMRANYWIAEDYVDPQPEQSELVRRPLSAALGGAFHEGGAIFGSINDDDYTQLVAWAKAHGAPVVDATPGFSFFAHRVQPVLVRKGCMQLQCHSASIFHDYRLRGGSGGSFSLTATRKNYDLSVAQLAFESDDPGVSRLVRKNLFRPDLGGTGIVHRGGGLFEDFPSGPASPALCDGKGYDYDNGDLDKIPGYCVIREWLKRERAARPVAPLSAIVYVRRDLTGAKDTLLDFDTYVPGSELRIADATLGANGAIPIANDRSLMSGCALDPATADVKRPSVSWDGTHIAFAARTAVDQPLKIYEANADGSSCAPIADIDSTPTTGNGLLIHNFDPAYGPPSSGSPIVFASTRGNLSSAPYGYDGPQRTPADPSRPNANLYVYENDPAKPGQHRIRQLTYLLNTERAPAFMADGRVIFTVEKRLPGFSQLSLRRINLDGGDYHPLYGQRGSLGYREVTQGAHLADKDFVAIFADHGSPHRGGALGIFSRSLGVDIGSTDPKDFVADPTVLDPNSMSAPDPSFFLHSLKVLDKSGLYTSPSALPNGNVLVSYGAADGDYDVYVVDRSTGARTKLTGVTGKADIEAVAVYGRAPRGTYKSQPSEPNAYGMDEALPYADVTIHDLGVITSIVMQNTPTGRVLDPDVQSLQIWEDLPPDVGITNYAQGGANVVTDDYGQVYVRRRLIGSVPLASDGSAHYQVTGGLPLVLRLPDTATSLAKKLPRTLNEHFMFTPGESVHEAMRRDLFDGFCAGCHSSLSGKPIDSALKPDVLTRASDTQSYSQKPTYLDMPPNQRGNPVGP